MVVTERKGSQAPPLGWLSLTEREVEEVLSRKLAYKSLPNIRDLGGMKTNDGRQIASGKLIRCGHLSGLSEEELSDLAGLVGVVIDFRTDGERLENPDAQIMDAVYYHIPIVESLTPGVSREEDSDRRVIEQMLFKPEEARQYMIEMYRSFVSDYAVEQYAAFIRTLQEGHEKALLWHCTAGKDRAGVASLIIEEILGVPQEVIVADYMKTNEYLQTDLRRLTAFVKQKAGTDSPLADKSLRYLFGTEDDYIKAYYKAVSDRYGSMNGLICDGMGLSDRDRKELQEAYLI